MSDSRLYRYFQEKAVNSDAHDYWGQVGRTVGGKAVDESQIALIVEAVAKGLDLAAGDVLLDLGCGNGALTDRFFARCGGGLGIDLSDNLIAIANRAFAVPPHRAYQAGDALELVETLNGPERFTKGLCYGSFMYFDDQAAIRLLTTLRQRCSAMSRLYLGNIPDSDRMAPFRQRDDYRPGMETDPQSPIGIWRTRAQISALAAAAGWKASFDQMPDGFYAATYRFDAILAPAGGGQ